MVLPATSFYFENTWIHLINRGWEWSTGGKRTLGKNCVKIFLQHKVIISNLASLDSLPCAPTKIYFQCCKVRLSHFSFALCLLNAPFVLSGVRGIWLTASVCIVSAELSFFASSSKKAMGAIWHQHHLNSYTCSAFNTDCLQEKTLRPDNIFLSVLLPLSNSQLTNSNGELQNFHTVLCNFGWIY